MCSKIRWHTTKQSRTNYSSPVVLYRNQPDGWVAEVPAISDCYVLMATREAALTELENIFQMIAAEYHEKGLPLRRTRPKSCMPSARAE